MNRIEKCGLCGNAVTHTFDIWNGNSSSDRLNEEVQVCVTGDVFIRSLALITHVFIPAGSQR